MSFFSNMLKYSFNPNPKKNWSEWVFGGGLPVQAAMKADKMRAEENAVKDSAAADAAAKQTEFEASAKAGLERLALRRKRGFASSMIVDPASSLGTTSTLGV